MDVIVETRCGRLRGAVVHSPEGYDYCAFKGVPYAKPPVGSLRFCDPLPPEPWIGVRDALDFGPVCAQIDFVTKSPQGSDDCLYLNVYVKSCKTDQCLPVMVWIHGGGYIIGGGDDFFYGPDYFLKKDIVLVTINYRIGVLGFLNFDDEAAPGNQGLKDQVMALRWVQNNIKNFGGDPNNVTLFGESAGAASVQYLAVSDLTKGLFHKAISQSGSMCNSWAFSPHTSNSYRLCEALGNKSKDPKELVDFLRTIDCDKLVEAQEDLRPRKEKLIGVLPFVPCVDRKSKDPIVPIEPSKALEKGIHVPYIIGCNSWEGMYNLIGLKEEDYDHLDRNFDKYLNPVVMEILEKNQITPNDLKRFYYGNEKICKANYEKLVRMSSDFHIVEGTHRTVKSQVQNSSAPTYFYRFTYDKGFSLIKMFAKTTMEGTTHFDEVSYLFSTKVYDMVNKEPPKPGSSDYKVMERMIELWVNFAKWGTPTPVTSDLIPTYWLPVTNEHFFRTLNIGEELRMESTINVQDQLSFGKYMQNKL